MYVQETNLVAALTMYMAWMRAEPRLGRTLWLLAIILACNNTIIADGTPPSLALVDTINSFHL